MSTLKELAGIDQTWVSQRARNALDIQNAFNNSWMSRGEAMELLKNLVDTDALNKEATDFEIKTKLVNAVNSLIALIDAAKGATS